MNLINLTPYWNSLDSVRRVHSNFELASIVCFGLLAFFDVLSHRAKDEKAHKLGTIGLCFFVVAVACELLAYSYGQRNDKLSEGVITSLAEKARDASQAADRAKSTADGSKAIADGVKEKVAVVDRKASTLTRQLDADEQKFRGVESGLDAANKEILAMGPRVMLVSSIDDKRLSELLRKSPFQKVCGRFLNATDDVNKEAENANQTLVTALVERVRPPSWRNFCIPQNSAILSRSLVGTSVMTRDDADVHTQEVAKELQNILRDAGITSKYDLAPSVLDRNLFPNIPPDVIQIWTGRHP